MNLEKGDSKGNIKKVKVLESDNQSSEYLESDLNGKIKGSGSEENEREEELVNAPVRILIQCFC